MAQTLKELVPPDVLRSVDLDSDMVMLWTLAGDRVLAASKPALRLFNAFRDEELTGRRFGAALHSTVRIAELGRFMNLQDPPRVERLRLFLGMRSEVITCLCQRVLLADGTEALLMISKEQRQIARRWAGAADGQTKRIEPDKEQVATFIDTPVLDRTVITAVQVQLNKPEADAPALHLQTATDVTTIPGSTPRVLDGKPVRFVFETDAAMRITTVSPQLTAALGLSEAQLLGHDFPHLRETLGLGGIGPLCERLATHKTWQGVVLTWPLTGAQELVPVELSGLPVLTQQREFRGYRGFGLIRFDQISAVTVEVLVPAHQVDVPKTAVVKTDEVRNSGSISVEAITSVVQEPEAVADAKAQAVQRASSINQALSALQAERADRLSQSERNAFREIARVLGGAAPSHTNPPAVSPMAPLSQDAQERAGTHHEDEANWHDDAIEEAKEDAPQEQAQDADLKHSQTELLSTPDILLQQAIAPQTPGMLHGALLDRLPIGILILRDEQALFLNRTLLDLLDYEDMTEFNAEAALATLFEGHSHLVAEEGAFNIVNLRARTGDAIPVAAHLQTLDFEGSPATLMSFRRAGSQTTISHTDAPVAENAPAASPTVTTKDTPSADIQPLRTGPARLHVVQTSQGQANLHQANQPSEREALGAQQAQREAERERDEMRAVLDTATDGVISLDGEGRIIGLNRSAEALFGLHQNEVAGERLSVLLAGDSHATAMDYFDGVKSGGVASLLNDGREVTGREKKGGRIPLFMTLGRISEQDSGKFCAVLRDLTAWKKAEAELTESRRVAERASAMKSDFLAKISHEIRTPMNAIIGFAEVMLTEQLGPIGHERYKEYLGDIHSSGEHVVSLVNDLLDLSKIEAGQADLSFTSVNLNGIVQDCVSMMQPQATRERVIIRTSLGEKLPAVVADARSIKQVVLNLLSNATKFNQPGGQVIVSTALNDEGEAVIRVRDTGIGMTEKETEAAMQPFRQVSMTRRGGGTGLGLPLSKALVEANRASLTMKSTPRQGTLAEVIFPATRVLAE